MRGRAALIAKLGAMALSLCGGAAMLTLALIVSGAPPSSSRVQAQSGTVALGYNSCSGSECHTRNGEIDWLTKQPGGKEHKASFNGLKNAATKSEKYAKAVGLAKFDEPTGMCVKCHATYSPTATPMIDGVTCEGCHGPAKGYRTFHSQNPKEYDGSVQRGMRNLKGKPAAWVSVCRDCHVLDKRSEYDALVEEGHPDGAKWNVTRKYVNVATHWKKVTYTAEMVGAGKPVAVAVTPPPAPVPLPAPPPPVPPGEDPVKSEKPTIAKTPTPAPTPAPTPGIGAPPAIAPVPPSIPSPAVAVPPLSLAPPAPVTATGLLAALQDRVEGLLESLLRRNSVPSVPLRPLPQPPAFSGADAELLRLQYEALGLAIEALNLKITPPGPPK